MWPTVRIYRGLEILNESVVLLKFGLCRCALPYAPVLTRHTFTLTCTFTHTCAHNTARTPNTSHSHSLPDQEPRATSPLTSRLPTEATGFYLHSRPLRGLQLQGQRLRQPTAPILPSQENRLSQRVWASKLKAIAHPTAFSLGLWKESFCCL